MPAHFDEAWLIRYMTHHGLTPAPQDASSTHQHPDTPEKTLLAQVRRLAQSAGFIVYHTHRSDKSEPGFPDLVLAKPGKPGEPGRLLFVELKSAKGKLTYDQHIWLDVLRHTLPGIEVEVWRPADLPRIAGILARA